MNPTGSAGSVGTVAAMFQRQDRGLRFTHSTCRRPRLPSALTEPAVARDRWCWHDGRSGVHGMQHRKCSWARSSAMSGGSPIAALGAPAADKQVTGLTEANVATVAMDTVSLVAACSRNQSPTEA